MGKTIRVIVAEDNLSVRTYMVGRLSHSPNILVLGEAPDGGKALELTHQLQPDVLVMDISLPDITGPQVIRQLITQGSPVRILLVSAENDPTYIQGLLENGASGYLIKDQVPNKLIEAVQSVANGQGYLP